MTEQEQAQLLPCPFCGGEAKYEAGGEWQYYDAWSVECRECGASLSGNADMRVSGASAKAEAITSWNTRHTATAEALDAMQAEVKRLTYASIHTCHADCPRLPCVQRREIDGLRADVRRLTNELQAHKDALGQVRGLSYYD